VNSTALASGALHAEDDAAAQSAASKGWDALAAWQLDDGAFPVADGDAAGDARATAQGVLGLAETNYVTVVGITAK
jgi:hypothetical protein